jgi:hypothetical protein
MRREACNPGSASTYEVFIRHYLLARRLTADYASYALKKTLLFCRRFELLLLFCLFGLPAGVDGQTFRFGGIVAGQVTSVVTVTSGGSTGRVLFGPTVEMRLPHYLSIEVDGLYQSRFIYDNTSSSYSGTSGTWRFQSYIDTHSWEVPALLTWHGLERHRNVFFGGGVSFRSVYGTFQQSFTLTPYCFTSNCPSPPPPNDSPPISVSDLPNHQTFGGVIHGGLEFRKGGLNLRPQFRYIRWGSPIEKLNTSQDSVQVLLSISFGK